MCNAAAFATAPRYNRTDIPIAIGVKTDDHIGNLYPWAADCNISSYAGEMVTGVPLRCPAFVLTAWCVVVATRSLLQILHRLRCLRLPC